MSAMDELREIAAELYRIADDAGLVPGKCLNPDEGDCMRDCGDCGYYRCDLRDRLLALGVDI